ncbi:hypothetical protein U1Q18_026111, partial [Sarracenia purpurea var. burkii]
MRNRNAATVEARVAVRATELALYMGLAKVQLEGDAAEIIQAINNKAKDVSNIEGIIEAIKRKAKDFQ